MSTRQAEVATAEYESPWGWGSISVMAGRLVAVDLPAVPAGVQSVAPVPAAPRADRLGAGAAGEAGDADRAALARWVADLEAYFRGERLVWSAEEVGLDEFPRGSFYRAVYAALLSVPPAVTVSYGGLAEMAGFPRAARAIGTAMATNPIPVVIPCHRVIRSDGRLGNYGDDPAWKERLLAHELDHCAASPGER